MNSYKKLISNSFIFAVGNLGSKLISFILVPLYTYYLSTEQYGTVDLVITTVSMLLPIVSFSIFEAVLRFVMDRNKPQNIIMTNSIFIAFVGIFMTLLSYPIMSLLNIFGDNLIYLYIILILQVIERILMQYTRAVGEIKIFAINGILLTFFTGSLNILFLVYLELGITGYFTSVVLANIISITFLLLATNAYKEISISNIDIGIIKDLLSFSIPMIPNSLMWWLVNASSRYFILFYVGVGANGLFAVASKIPSLINIINQVFTQAWQISAIEEYENENKSDFYSNVFTYLSSVLLIGTSILIVLIKVFFNLLFAAEYFPAWEIVPFLLLGTVFSSFSGFLGTNYIAAKQTKGVFKTSVYGGVISILLNFIFIPTFGIIGAGISSMISFFSIFIIRYYDTKKYIDMKINWRLFIQSLILIIFQIYVLMSSFSGLIEITIEIFLFILLIILNRKLFKPIFRIIKSIRRKDK